MTPLPDYHMHTTLCNHATGNMEAYVEQAIAMGVTEMGFSEHMPVMPEPHLAMTWDDMPVYLDSVRRLQDNYGDRITIRLGAEMDMDLTRADEIAGILATYPFDYVIGSVHYLDDWPFDQEQYRERFGKSSLVDLYGRFFEALTEAAKSGFYDIAGHIDNLKRMGHHPPAGLDDIIDELALTFKESDVAVELNTSGYDHEAAEAYPSPAILDVLRRYDVPVTVGSDAHRPEDVARHFDRARTLLISLGFDRVAFFDGRRRKLRPIDMDATEVGA